MTVSPRAVIRLIGFGMIRPEALLIDGEGAAHKRFGLRRPVCIFQEPRQSFEADGHLGVSPTEVTRRSRNIYGAAMQGILCWRDSNSAGAASVASSLRSLVSYRVFASEFANKRCRAADGLAMEKCGFCCKLFSCAGCGICLCCFPGRP